MRRGRVVLIDDDDEDERYAMPRNRGRRQTIKALLKELRDLEQWGEVRERKKKENSSFTTPTRGIFRKQFTFLETVAIVQIFSIPIVIVYASILQNLLAMLRG